MYSAQSPVDLRQWNVHRAQCSYQSLQALVQLLRMEGLQFGKVPEKPAGLELYIAQQQAGCEDADGTEPRWQAYW